MLQGTNIRGKNMKNLNSKIFIIIALLCSCFIFNNGLVSADPVNREQNVGVNYDMDDYIRLTRRYIKNNWYPPISSFEHSAKIAVKLDKNGQLLDCHIIESSNDNGFDDSLINAARKTTYKPLPESYKKETAELYLSFSMQRHHVSK